MSGPRRTGLIGLAAAVGVVALLLTQCWIVVQPGEVAVVQRWGRMRPAVIPAGPHGIWPFGIDRVRRIRTDQVRQLGVGSIEPAGPEQEPGAGEFLTADRNLVLARAVIQFRVNDPVRYALAGEIEPTLVRLTESSLVAAIAGETIDQLLGVGRTRVAEATARRVAAEAARLQLGVAILGVSLTDARPPVEVEADFAAAQSARSDRDRRLIEAGGFAETSRAAARAEAGSRVDQAQAEAARRIALARASAERFMVLAQQAEASRRLTVSRLYRDALGELLPRVRRKVLLAPEEPVDLSLFGSGSPR